MTTACRLVQAGAILLGTAILASLFATPSVSASAPWIATGLAGCGLVLTAIMTPRRRLWTPRRITFTGVALCAFLFVAGVLTIDWPEYKYAWLSPLYQHMPSLSSLGIQGLGEGLQPNQIGGVWAAATAFCTAVGLASLGRQGDTTGGRKPILCASWLAAVIGACLVFLSGSRAALAALAVAVVCALVICSRRWLLLFVPGIAALCMAQASHHRLIPSVAQLLLHDEGATTKAVTRLDIWGSALRAFEDHPLTGIGLGVFNNIVPVRYPYSSVGLTYSVSQAHNVFLDTAVSLGIVGLAGLLLALIGTSLLAIRIRAKRDDRSPLALGLLSVLVVYIVFGIPDALSFSSPSSLVLWVSLSGTLVCLRLRYPALTGCPDTGNFALIGPVRVWPPSTGHYNK